MSSWTERIANNISQVASSRNAQLVCCALFSSGVTAALIFTFQKSDRERKIKHLKSSIDPVRDEHDPIPDKLEHQTFYNVGYFKRAHYHDRLGTAATEDPKREPRTDAEKSKKNDVQISDGTLVNGEKDHDQNSTAQEREFDEDLILEQLARSRVFLSDAGLAKLRQAFVIVIGCGGVGSHAAAALARSGVSKIRLLDFDQVTLSSLNRHAVANLEDVGTSKVQCIRKRLNQVAPWVRFDCRNELFAKSTAPSQLASWDGQEPTFVIDAIDNIDSKIDLLKYCHDNSLKVIASMGAGCKSDPTRVFIGDISASIEDPLSRSTRRRLRVLGVANGIPVVFSSEKATRGKAQLLPLPDDEFEKGQVGELGVLPDFRVRILPVLGTMPAVFGLCLANHVILDITGYPHEYIQSKSREKMYSGMLAALQGLEERIAVYYGEEALGLRIPVTAEDVGYLAEEIYRGRSVISGLSTRLALIRWDRNSNPVDRRFPGQKAAKLDPKDLVVMTKEEAAIHEQEVLKGDKSNKELYGEIVVDLVASRMREVCEYAKYR